MKYNIVKIVWSDITFSESLVSNKEAQERIHPTDITAVGFLVSENTENIALAQTCNSTTKTFLNVSIVPKGSIKELAHLKVTSASSDIALVTWLTEMSYTQAPYTKEDLKELVPATLSTVGFSVDMEKNLLLYTESTHQDGMLARSVQQIGKSLIKSTASLSD